MKQLVFWLIRMFIHQGGWQSFMSWRILTSFNHQFVKTCLRIWNRNHPPQFVFTCSCRRDKIQTVQKYWHTTTTNHVTYMHLAVKKSISLPFCKPVLFPNGFKTKNHLGNHVFCMLTKLHWSNTLCLIHLDKAKWISRTGSNSWSKTVAL